MNSTCENCKYRDIESYLQPCSDCVYGSAIGFTDKWEPIAGGMTIKERIIDGYYNDKTKLERFQKRLDKIVAFAEENTDRTIAWEIWLIASGGKDTE